MVVIRVVRNRPGWVNAFILTISAGSAIVVRANSPTWHILDVLRNPSGQGSFASLYLAIAGVAAMAAGFSGVVIIFGLQGRSRRFQRLRLRGGDRLRANWVSVVSTNFLASALALTAATWTLLDYPIRGAWTAVGAVFLVAHSSVRLVWLLKGLADIVEDEDRDDVRATLSDMDPERERSAVALSEVIRRSA